MRTWWSQTDNTEKIIHILVFLLTLAVCSYQTAFVSVVMGIAGVYIIVDCAKKKSIRGFYSDKACWLGIAIFLLTVLLASLLLGEPKSIRIAFNYVYWSLPFFLIIYFKKQTDVTYTVLLSVCVCILVDGLYTVYQYALILQGAAHIGRAGRIELFYGYPNHYAMFLITMLPLLLFALQDHQLKSRKGFVYVDYFLLVLGFWSLLKTGSRGAFFGLVAGCLLVLALYTYRNKTLKKFLAGLVLCLSVSGLTSSFVTGGMLRSYDTERQLLLQSSYAMWQDHKLLGVGLDNWANEYQNKYILPEAKERELTVPHNTIAWFLTTTGMIGAAGYLFFVLYYIVLLFRRTGEATIRKKWIIYAVLLSFLAVNFHGMVDVGITHKGIARLIYMLLGFALYNDKSCFMVEDVKRD